MRRLTHYILLAVLAVTVFSCRDKSDELLSYGRNDYQAFEPARHSYAEQFKAFWTAMNENYCIWDIEEEFGIDWDEVYKTYLPQFEALDDTTRQPVTDDEFLSMYSQFLDSLHDGHMTFDIMNLCSGNFIKFFPNMARTMRERPQVFQEEQENLTSLGKYRTDQVDANYRVKEYDEAGSAIVVYEVLDTILNRILVASAAYIEAVDNAGGPNDLNDEIYKAVQLLQFNANSILSSMQQPDYMLYGSVGEFVNAYNTICSEFNIVARQIGVVMKPLDTKFDAASLAFIRYALFEGNIAYIRLSMFYLSDCLDPSNHSSDTTSLYYAYQKSVYRVWSRWFSKIQVLHAAGQLGGVVIDVRNNGGGLVDDYKYILGALLPSGGFHSHTLRVKNGTGRLDFAPLIPFVMSTYPTEHAVVSERPIVVLANSNSISLAENTTWGVLSQPNGYFVGTRTFGALNALNTDPDSYSEMYSGAFGEMGLTPFYGRLPKYVCLYGDDLHSVEGHGFDPDLDLRLDVSLWTSEQRDNQLEAALDYVHKN